MSLCLATLLFTFLQGPSGSVSLFQGTPGQNGDVVVVDPSRSVPPHTPPALLGIRLLPIDFNGRTVLEELLPGRPRLVADVPGASRLVLPGGAGSLYRYARALPAGGVAFGFFVVDAMGNARPLWERPGAGSLQDADPFTERVAVAPDGGAFLVATELAAGGDLIEVDIATGTALNRTSGVAPQDFPRAGLALHGDWGLGVGTGAIWRFDRSSTGDASAVSFAGPAPGWIAGEVVLSRSGDFAATIAGDGPGSAHVFALTTAGNAVRVSQQPLALTGAGFLPESLHGPYLAISDDGYLAAWRAVVGTTREAFLGRVQVAQMQVTADQNYVDTLDEVGQFFFRAITNTLVLAVGELDDDPGGAGIEKVDHYEIGLSPGGQASFRNITLTSGDPTVPFTSYSAIEPEDGTWLTPAGDRLFFKNSISGGGGDLYAADLDGSGLQLLLPQARRLDRVDHAGSRILVSVRRAFDPRPQELHSFPATMEGAGTLVLSMPDGDRILRSAVRPDGWYAFVQTRLAGGERLMLHDTTTGQLKNLTNRNLPYGPALGFAPTGPLAFSVGTLASPNVYGLWPTAGPVHRLGVPMARGFVLPGA